MQIDEELMERIRTYQGDLASLEVAIGAYVVGQVYGWRAISVCHSAATVTRSNKILGFEIKEHCPARTQLSTRIRGIRLADKFDSFLKVSRSRIAGKRLVSDDVDQAELTL